MAKSPSSPSSPSSPTIRTSSISSFDSQAELNCPLLSQGLKTNPGERRFQPINRVVNSPFFNRVLAALLITAAVLMFMKKSSAASIATIGVLSIFTLQDGVKALKEGWKSKEFLKLVFIAISLGLTISSFKSGDNFSKSISTSAMFLGYMILEARKKEGQQRNIIHSVLLLLLLATFFTKIINKTHPDLNLSNMINNLSASLFVGFGVFTVSMLHKKENTSPP